MADNVKFFYTCLNWHTHLALLLIMEQNVQLWFTDLLGKLHIGGPSIKWKCPIYWYTHVALHIH